MATSKEMVCRSRFRSFAGSDCIGHCEAPQRAAAIRIPSGGISARAKRFRFLSVPITRKRELSSQKREIRDRAVILGIIAAVGIFLVALRNRRAAPRHKGAPEADLAVEAVDAFAAV